MTKLKKDRHTQAKKAARQNIRHYKRNVLLKNKIKKTIKKLNNLIQSGNAAESKKLFPEVTAMLHNAVNKEIFKKNKASRNISQLALRINRLSDSAQEPQKTRKK